MAIEKVFLSYAHSDSSHCKKICSFLTKCKIPFWHDSTGIPPSAEDFNELIEKAIDECNYFICVLTENIKNSDYCKKELERAFEWKKREPRRCIYILKMQEHLDNMNSLPTGCNLLAEGSNFLYAHNDELLEKAIERVADQMFDRNKHNSLVLEEFIEKSKGYISEELETIKLPKQISVLVDKNEEDHKHGDVVALLLGQKNIFLHGERGSGKTALIQAIYQALLFNLNKEITEHSNIFHIPIYIKLEKIWGCYSVGAKNVLYQICSQMNVPYCLDASVKYIILLDGEMRTTRGCLPEIVDLIIDNKKDIYSVLVSQSEHQFLNSSFKEYEVRKLNYPEVVNYITKTIDNELQIGRFFKRLLGKAFEETSYDESIPNVYFNVIKKIHKYFYDESKKENSSISLDDFYSINLAESTQKGRLPKGFVDDYEIAVWKKLIRGNEVFHAIRTPFYLNWLIDIFLSEKDLVFPYRLRTLQVKICQKMIDNITSNDELKKKIIFGFLVSLAQVLKQVNNGNEPITIAEFKKVVNNTNFNRIAKTLSEGGIINTANCDIVFQYDFMFNYFLNYANTYNVEQIESNLRTCKHIELTRLFLSYIPCDEPFAECGKDAVEIAADIILDERDCFNMTSDEKKLATEIITNKLKRTTDNRQRVSILNGIGKLFRRLDLSLNEEDFFDINNRTFWHKNDDGTLLSIMPIPFYYFNLFIAEGYQKEQFWEYGRESIVVKNGGLRKRPLKVDDGISCIFEIVNHPVVGISWYEAQAFCKWLQEKLGNGIIVNLPRIEQIESFLTKEKISAKQYNALNGERFNSTTPVGVFLKDNAEPVDILGNVWEWSSDVFEFYGDVIAKCYGGSWINNIIVNKLHTTYPARLSSNNVGFRVVLKQQN